jgi:hypothetical protein
MKSEVLIGLPNCPAPIVMQRIRDVFLWDR